MTLPQSCLAFFISLISCLLGHVQAKEVVTLSETLKCSTCYTPNDWMKNNEWVYMILYDKVNHRQFTTYMLKEFDKLAASRVSFTKVTFAKVNLEDDLDLGKRWNVEPPNVPTTILFHNWSPVRISEEQVQRLLSDRSMAAMRWYLEEVLSPEAYYAFPLASKQEALDVINHEDLVIIGFFRSLDSDEYFDFVKAVYDLTTSKRNATSVVGVSSAVPAEDDSIFYTLSNRKIANELGVKDLPSMAVYRSGKQVAFFTEERMESWKGIRQIMQDAISGSDELAAKKSSRQDKDDFDEDEDEEDEDEDDDDDEHDEL